MELTEKTRICEDWRKWRLERLEVRHRPRGPWCAVGKDPATRLGPQPGPGLWQGGPDRSGNGTQQPGSSPTRDQDCGEGALVCSWNRTQLPGSSPNPGPGLVAEGHDTQGACPPDPGELIPRTGWLSHREGRLFG